MMGINIVFSIPQIRENKETEKFCVLVGYPDFHVVVISPVTLSVTFLI